MLAKLCLAVSCYRRSYAVRCHECALSLLLASHKFSLRVLVLMLLSVLLQPVVASDGHTYERLEIERWLRNTHQVKASAARGGTSELSCSSPMTGEPMDGRLVPNEAIRRQIDE